MSGIESDQGELMMNGRGSDEHISDIYRLSPLSQDMNKIPGSISDSVVNG